MSVLRRFLLLFYHVTGIFVLLGALLLSCIVKRRKHKSDDLVVLSPFALAFDGRVQKSLIKISAHFRKVTLHKPQDAAEANHNFMAKMPKNVEIKPIGYSGSYVYFPFSFDLITFISLLKSDAGMIYCHDTNTALMGLLAGQLSGKKVTVDFHEWMSETVAIHLNGEVTQLSFLKRKIFGYIEKKALKNADYLITVASTIADGLHQKTKIKRDFLIIKNTGSIVTKPEKIMPQKAQKEELTLLYIGQVHFHRNIENLIKGLEGTEKIKLVIQGTCPPLYKTKLDALTESLKLKSRVTFKDPVLPSKVIQAIGEADIGIMSCKTFSKNLKLSLPNKVFEYIHAERPFLCENLPAVKELLGDVPFIHYFDSEDPASFRKALLTAQADKAFLNAAEALKKAKTNLFSTDDFDQYIKLKG